MELLSTKPTRTCRIFERVYRPLQGVEVEHRSSPSHPTTSVIPVFVHPSNKGLKEYTGGCHCKRFRFKFTHPPFENGERDVVYCNCSICAAKGCFWLTGMLEFEKNVVFTSGSIDEFASYEFGQTAWKHLFCPACGVQPVVLNNKTQGGGVNIRSVDDVGFDKLKVVLWDGKSLPL